MNFIEKTTSYNQYLQDLQAAIAKMSEDYYEKQLIAAYSVLKNAEVNNKLIIICGNGGSAADASHFAAELVCRFEKDRAAIRAISLATDTSTITAISNDFAYEMVFVRQIEALASVNDVLIIFSTSGKSMNCIEAAKIAKSLGIITILFTGDHHERNDIDFDVVVEAPSQRTSHIQEINRIQYHLLCAWIEEDLRV